MDLSFIIITNGKKKIELLNQIQSIQNLNIPKYEIIICGDISYFNYLKNNNLTLLEDSYNASRGSLGGLRNRACAKAKYENLVISDDDMLFSESWYNNLLDSTPFEILTTCIRNPDGTRFWDNACYQSPTRGHINLNYDEHDDHLYMSGGQSWLIKRELWESVKWDEDLLIYKMNNLTDYSKGLHNEDTDFALRCRSQNIKIQHNPNIVVFHNDKTYTGIGRMVRRRSFYKDHLWVKDVNFPEKVCLELSVNLINYGIHAEGIDLLRFLYNQKQSFSAKAILENFEVQLGGALENSKFYFDYHPDYTDLLKKTSILK